MSAPIPWRRPLNLAFAVLMAAAAAQAEPDPAAAPETPGAARQADEKTQMAASAPGLIREYLAKRHAAAGERLEIAIKLAPPEPVQGWPGRWRFVGTATLRHYRDTEFDAPARNRVIEIRETQGLSAKKKMKLIERTTFLRTETIAFEACITGTGADASIDFTLH